jgi:serine protease AprX
LRHFGVEHSGSRANALWGRGGRKAGVVVAATSLALMLTASAAAAGADNGNGKAAAAPDTYVPASLQNAAEQNPKQSFDVIVQGERRDKAQGFVAKLLQSSGGSSDEAIVATEVKRTFLSIDGAQLTLTGKQILHLEKLGIAQSILPNAALKLSSVALPESNEQKWPWSSAAAVDWNSQALALQAPTIAVVDSGIDATRTDFGSRVIGQVDLASMTPDSPGDGYGHGTFVAGVAAGAAAGYAGVAPSANLVSVKVMNDQGQATVSDVVAACDWILRNKSTYNIKVANFSLQGSTNASVFFDPLDQAVEKLWLNGVVVVAAAGNYGTNGQASGVLYAPGNDPFVITVGAADINDTVTKSDDTVAPWSAWGQTGDGFMKPDLAAPGRYIIGPVPSSSYLTSERPDHVAAPGYMQLSGTSFSAPQVAGAAALILAEHPTWTPDQVKGALMVSADATPAATQGSLGVGELDVAAARAVTNPPNPNAGLDQFLKTDAAGATVFDSAAWQSAAQSNAAWNSAAWGSAAWSSAAWGSAAWSSAAWSDAAWGSAAWGSAAWGSAAWSSAAWSSAAWGSAAWSDAAWGDTASASSASGSAAWSDAAWSDATTATSVGGLPATLMTDADITAAENALGIVDPACDPILNTCTAP